MLLHCFVATPVKLWFSISIPLKLCNNATQCLLCSMVLSSKSEVLLVTNVPSVASMFSLFIVVTRSKLCYTGATVQLRCYTGARMLIRCYFANLVLLCSSEAMVFIRGYCSTVQLRSYGSTSLRRNSVATTVIWRYSATSIGGATGLLRCYSCATSLPEHWSGAMVLLWFYVATLVFSATPVLLCYDVTPMLRCCLSYTVLLRCCCAPVHSGPTLYAGVTLYHGATVLLCFYGVTPV